MSEPEPAGILFPAPPRPAWLGKLTLLLLVPLLVGGGNPFIGVFVGLTVAKYMSLPWVFGVFIGLSLVTVPTAAALVALFYRHRQYRDVRMDDHGFLFGFTPKWPGTRVRWEEIAGFQLTGWGLMLRLKKSRLSRWLGPIVHCQERGTHDLVVTLEERGVFADG